MPIQKAVTEIKNYQLNFSEEEALELGLTENKRYSIIESNGKITLVPFATIELDLADFPKELLVWLIQQSADQDISINDVIANVLSEIMNRLKN